MAVTTKRNSRSSTADKRRQNKESTGKREKTGGGAASSGASRRTTNHDVIRRWIESRGGSPAIVKDTRSKGKSVGLLRVDFPGFRGRDRLQEVSWDEFFRTFDENDLVFLYQDKTATGRPSRFSKFVSKATARK